MTDEPTPTAEKPRRILPPFSKPIIIAAIVLDIIVFAGFSRKGIFVGLMLFFNIGVCAVAYFAILRYLEGRLFRDKDQSPSRKSSPISE
ncbi:hypothetical protein [Rhodovulum adriaticum]|uniref:Uncharacterized protein n=1 Tax=Rhodovulum adriaticum TaxID=35804 RepID=A0A4R2NYQ7_RHOAD|nr:hypothetical protein [Rhodovulum adriaticum]MBK1634952.1 hypothetical protein [Rhodovulum adriaticum]TCP27423.1 hypothetical protein EV656_101329 [Rhodovulum adriaticum]